MSKELPKAYDPQKYEDSIYKKWEESDFFNPDTCVKEGVCKKDADTYTIILPPPNITDKLHLGHVVMVAVSDILIRYNRMNGKKTLWVPGTDHAAIATQNVVEKKLLKEEKKSRHDLGREKFLAEVNKFVKETQATIISQLKKTGASLDWSREAFTLDEQRQQAVKQMFVDMYQAGAIYQGHRIVNWCPRCQSTLADDEVEHKEQDAKFYTFKYSKDFPFAISTTRPETKLGDTAVAVNPKDARYKKYIGQEFNVNFCGVDLKLKVIADKEVDPEFGTGALGVTPAHSMVDYAMAQKNDLEIKKIINEQGKMIEGLEEFSGKNVKEARKMVVAKLIEQGLLEKEEDIKNSLAICYRCGAPIEPLTSKQWFVGVDKKLKKLGNKSLKERAIEVAKKGEIKFTPERFTKRYLDWMENLHDWCISRQIWFGHQIPVWYCKSKVKSQKSKVINKCDEPIVSVENIDKCPHCEGEVEQEEDVLDTWFSSGMWTFSTLGWPGGNIEIIASRHGDTDVHSGNKYIGQEEEVNFDLNKTGKEQAEELAEKLKNEKIDVIFSSDLKRALQTAEIVNKHHNAEIITDERIREYSFGVASGKTFEEFESEYSDAPSWEEKEIDHKFLDMERPIEVKNRVESFLKDLKNKYAGKKVFIATHGGVLDFFEMIMNKKSFQEIKKMNYEKCGIEEYKVKLDEDLKTYHPTQVLETGYEIITLWVSRMIMMSLFAVDQIPFENVYLHGMILDKQGKKMSKSKGNGIDPIEMIERYGTDATRMSLIVNNTPGNDMKMNEEKIASYRNFANKLWNISRFILQNDEVTAEINKQELTLADKWILGSLDLLNKTVTDNINNFDFSHAGETLRNFTWNDFADWYLEVSKFEKTANKNIILIKVLKDLLKLWHPFMPFVTESIWQEMEEKRLLMIESWPERDNTHDLKISVDFDLIRDIITAIRQIKSANKILPKEKVKAIIYAGDKVKLIESQAELIKSLRTGVEELEVKPSLADGSVGKNKGEKIVDAKSAKVGDIEIYIL